MLRLIGNISPRYEEVVQSNWRGGVLIKIRPNGSFKVAAHVRLFTPEIEVGRSVEAPVDPVEAPLDPVVPGPYVELDTKKGSWQDMRPKHQPTS